MIPALPRLASLAVATGASPAQLTNALCFPASPLATAAPPKSSPQETLVLYQYTAKSIREWSLNRLKECKKVPHQVIRFDRGRKAKENAYSYSRTGSFGSNKSRARTGAKRRLSVSYHRDFQRDRGFNETPFPGAVLDHYI
ncbi:hypothetical protein ABZP36_026369 [Zizania latifolia]